MNFIEEAQDRAEKLARVAAEEKKVTDAQKAREKMVSESSKGINESYFAKQTEQAALVAATNARNAAAQAERDRTGAARRRAENQAQIDQLHAKINLPPTGFLDMYGEVPCKRKAPITLQPLPSKYPSSDPRNGMSEELIIRMGMNPDPTQPAIPAKK